MVYRKKVKIKGQEYWYLFHTIREGDKFLKKSKYIGKELPKNIKEIEEKFEKEIHGQKTIIKDKPISEKEKKIFLDLKDRKELIEIYDEKNVFAELTKLGEKISKKDLDKNLIENLTPEILAKKSWKGKKFRRYDVSLEVPKIYSGKRHFVNQAIDYAKRIWTDTGFEEMEGEIINESFWNFDALFTPQDHPARELQDSIFLDRKSEIKEKELLKKI